MKARLFQREITIQGFMPGAPKFQSDLEEMGIDSAKTVLECGHPVPAKVRTKRLGSFVECPECRAISERRVA